MSVKLTKLDKNLNLINQVDIPMTFAEALTISHFTDLEITASEDLTFSFDALPSSVPVLEEEDFVVVIREKVNFSDNTPSEITTKNNGDLEGRKNYKNAVPYSHPNGVAAFKELRGRK